jgi:hypothetical protein
MKQAFEIHVTIDKTDNLKKFEDVCTSFTNYVKIQKLEFQDSQVMSCKPIIIELPCGVYMQQPMCSLFVYSTEFQAIKYGKLFANYCQMHDFKCLRNKVEARLNNTIDFDVDLDLLNYNKIYWEFHVKLLFDSNENIKEFEKQLEINYPEVRLSKSTLSKYKNLDKICRIVTLRLYNGNKQNALGKLEKLLIFLNSQKTIFEVSKKIEKELCVFDSNLACDAGWMD